MKTISSAAVTLADLPSASGKTGWPWTDASTSGKPADFIDGRCPKITIVTCSYNQGQYIEETIRSVLLQNYPRLEYIIIDGGSTDDSIAIIKKYEKWLNCWISESDFGQSHALNKGFEKATGSVAGFLNSDDMLLPGSLIAVAQKVMEESDDRLIIMGNSEMGTILEVANRTCSPSIPKSFMDAIGTDGLCPQPSTFWTIPTIGKPLRFNEGLNFCMDLYFWCELLEKGYRAVQIDRSLSFYRHHIDAKGQTIATTMWANLAAIPLMKLTSVPNFNEKLELVALMRRRLRHYTRLEIEKLYLERGRSQALRSLIWACCLDFGLLWKMPTLGLARRLIFGGIN